MKKVQTRCEIPKDPHRGIDGIQSKVKDIYYKPIIGNMQHERSKIKSMTCSKFFSKKHTKFDQEFLNEEEDKPLDNRRLIQIPRV
jgi:hypothetical protein